MSNPGASSKASSGLSVRRVEVDAPARAMTVGVVGARGYVGAELLKLIDRHGGLELGFAASGTHAGRPIREAVPEVRSDAAFVEASPEVIAAIACDAYILALPNHAARAYVEAIERTQPDAVIVDVSADYRFDDGWVYGLPELNRARIIGSRRISNPGCYATAMMLALAPIRERLDGIAHVFGVSGFSGAGATPTDRNNTETLAASVLPYQLNDHTHEREVTRHLGRAVRFGPHVGPFFKGLTVTALVELTEAVSAEELTEVYRSAYAGEPLIEVRSTPPLARELAGRLGVVIGGIGVSAEDGRRVSVVAGLDNLLKGAASQAIQNMNLALGMADTEGLL